MTCSKKPVSAKTDMSKKRLTKCAAVQAVDDPNAEDQRQALNKYTIDLTERAEQGKLDPVIGTG